MSAGKIVGGFLYIHQSAVDDLPIDLFIKYREHLQALKYDFPDFDYTIIAIGKKDVHFVMCNDWDFEYEPIVQDRVVVWKQPSEAMPNGQWKTELRKASPNNPFVYHHRNIFVKEDYDGFDYEDDCYRSDKIKQLNPDKLRMGRSEWWKTFCETHNL